jgi:gliding motility-associated lipoprotein GldD
MNYGQVEKKTEYFDTDPIHPCWFDIALPDFDGRIHFSYVSIENSSHFDKLVADAFKLSGKHNVKANYIDEIPFKNKQGVSGMVFNLEGPVASPFQFFMTDTTEHFLRGSLYLNTEIRPDSLAPIYEFLKKDITLILNTLEWEDN